MENIIVSEEANKILCKENNLQAIWMCAALEIMGLYSLEQLCFGWAFNFKDYDIRDVSIEYVLEANHRIILAFEKNFLSFRFMLRCTNSTFDKSDLLSFKEEIKRKYKLDDLKIDQIISYMEIEVLKKENSDLEAKVKDEGENEWIEGFRDYGFSDLSIDKLATMKIKCDPAGVYILRDLDNGKRYVGQGKKVITRALEHFTEKENDDVSRAYKAGHKFVVERIVTGYKDGSDFCLNQVEAQFIEYFDTKNCGYNRTRGNVKGMSFNGTKLAREYDDVDFNE